MLFESTIHMHAKGKVVKVWFSTFSVYFEDNSEHERFGFLPLYNIFGIFKSGTKKKNDCVRSVVTLQQIIQCILYT